MVLKLVVTDNAENRTTNRGNFPEKNLEKYVFTDCGFVRVGYSFSLESRLFKQGCARFP